MNRSAADPARVIRVLLVAPAGAVGGQAHAARDIVQGFAGHSRILVAQQQIDPLPTGGLRRLARLRLIRTLIRPFTYCRQLLRAVPNADVVQVFCTAHLAFLLGAVPAIVISKLFRRRLILHYHDGRAASHLRWWGPFPRLALRLGDRLVVPSRYLQHVFAPVGLTAQVIPNVVDTTAFQYRRPDPLRRRLISARSLETLYGVENSLAAFRLLREEFPELTLDVYGGGPAAGALERLVRSWGLQGVTFQGEIPHSRMPDALKAGGIMVNSSRADNMPHFVIEAFAAGTPIVSTRVGGIPYLIEEGRNGFLVPVDDPPAMAAAVRQLLRDPAKAVALAESGRQECAAYSWTAAGPQWEALYLELARGGTG